MKYNLRLFMPDNLINFWLHCPGRITYRFRANQ